MAKFNLEGCPKCGQVARFSFRSYGVEVTVECEECGLHTEWYTRQEDAAVEWNDQPRIKALTAKISELQKLFNEERLARIQEVEEWKKRVRALDHYRGTPLPSSPQRGEEKDRPMAYVAVEGNPVPLRKCARCGEMFPAEEMTVDVGGSPRKWLCTNCGGAK